MFKIGRKNLWHPFWIAKVILVLVVLYILNISLYNSAKLTYVKLTPINTMLKNDTISALNAFILSTAVADADDSLYMYNKFRSDKVGPFRLLPESRDAVCSQRLYRVPEEDLKVSIIIVYHNEARSVLVRTLVSILARTSSRYLEEILLLDDYSKDVKLLTQLITVNLATHFSVRIRMHRNSQRLGVIASRNLGAKLALGHYLVFLDSHCEVNVGWLEPLLDRMTASVDDNVAVSPTLDSIDATTFDYHRIVENVKGGFDWSLHFHWVPLYEPIRKGRDMELSSGKHSVKAEQTTQSFKSPTFSGGIFMISRNWFFKLNGFNSLLEIWGGESIEMSIKMWLCGGQIEIIPCSRVGHVFRKQHPFGFPHGDNGQLTYLRNSKVIADSWLDEYKYLFYASKPAARNISISVPTRAVDKLKQDLHCRPFSWFLQAVFKELKLPNEEYVAYGQLSSDARCLHITGHQLYMTSCYENDVTEWHLGRTSGQLLVTSGACLNVVESRQQQQRRVANAKSDSWFGGAFVAVPHRNLAVVLQFCKSSGASQRWLRHNGRLIHAATRLCLDNPLKDVVTVSRCRRVAPTQLFRFSMEMQQF